MDLLGCWMNTLASASHKVPAAVQLVPAEIMYMIFDYLLEPYHYLIPFRLENVPPSFMVNIVNVCRSWRVAATPYLYKQPLLRSHHHLGLFTRTLTNRPDLSVFIEALFIIDRDSSLFTRTWEFITRQPELSTNMNRLGSLVPTLRSVVVMEVLTRFDRPHISPEYHSHFSNHLRVLSLRMLWQWEDIELPQLPHLHTLQLIQCGFTRSVDINEAIFPSLKILELYGRDTPSYIVVSDFCYSQLSRILLSCVYDPL
ncbi:hypothetical protein C8Q75DRAFT_308281 [Abortiporus biennis]|nr:hypothetical protein C8Q75DRAFT_308281 [Abortiporus biennis]